MIGAEFEFFCPPSFSSKYCCLTPRLCGHVDHIDLLLWATPSDRRYGGSRVVYILQQLLLYETTRPAITGIWRGGWPSAISYCILVDHGGDWNGGVKPWASRITFSDGMEKWRIGIFLSWDISTTRLWASWDKENYRWNHVVSIISRRNFQAKTRANDLALNFNRQ